MILGDKYIINVRDVSKSAKPIAPEIFDNNDKKVDDITATTGQVVQLQCAASGVPTPTIEWKFINQYGNEMTPFFTRVHTSVQNLTP